MCEVEKLCTTFFFVFHFYSSPVHNLHHHSSIPKGEPDKLLKTHIHLLGLFSALSISLDIQSSLTSLFCLQSLLAFISSLRTRKTIFFFLRLTHIIVVGNASTCSPAFLSIALSPSISRHSSLSSLKRFKQAREGK